MEKKNNKKQEIRELEKRYKLFYEYAPIPYQSLDVKTNIIDVNQVWLDFLGYDKEEVIGKCFGEFLVLKSRELLTSRFSQFKEGGVIQDVEYEVIKKDETRGIILLDGRIEYFKNGDFKQAHCFFKDITERNQTEKDLKESEEKFRNIAEQSFMSIYIIQDGIIKYRNQRATDVSGYTSEDVKNWKPYDYAKVIHPEDRELVLNQSRKKQEGDPDVLNRYKYRVMKKSGGVVWLDNFSKTINYKGRPADLVMTEDITEKILSEQKLNEAEIKYRSFLENFQGIAFQGNLDYTPIFFRGNVKEITGYEEKDFISENLSWDQIILEEDKKNLNDTFDSIHHTPNTVIDREYRIVTKDGKQKWIHEIISNITDKNGKPYRVQGIINEITYRKKTEKALLDSEEKYKYLFDNAQVGLYWSRISDGKFLECNDVFAKLFGFTTREEILEDYIASEHYVYPNQRKEILDAIRLNNEVRGFEILVTKKDGTPIWLSVSARISEKENRIEGAAIDITKRKKAEQELLESEERYRRAYDKADFYKDLLAHDVGNILNNISASVQLMKIWTDDINLSMKERDMMGIIKQQLERGGSLVSNVRKLSEIEERDVSVTSIDAKKIIEDCITNVRSRFHKKDLELNFDTFQEVANVLGGDLLIDAFENLIINGVIHNDSKTIKLWVNLSKFSQEGKKFVKIEFKDNGIGIIEDRKNSIFKRNYRKDRSTGGMGIGLSLVKNIIKSYEGQTWVENRVTGDYSKGSNFIVLLKEG